MVETIEWRDGAPGEAGSVVMIDQRKLPREQVFVECHNYLEVADAIKTMVIRGAPAIGVAAAMGVALGVQKGADFETVCATLAATRPTAVNLFWAIERMKRLYASLAGKSSGELASAGKTTGELASALIDEAKQIRLDEKTVLTHCNAGALATAGYGTALGVIRAAVESGKTIDVFADETRPFLQGARLTAWELQQDGIPTTLITDNMAGHFLKSGRIGCVVVGADRIASNGDVANKIGTYSVAVLAKENGVPFYVAAPVSTFDLALASGDQIPIEQRSRDEVTNWFGVPIAPEEIDVQNPAFDVTPARYVTAIICEHGVARAPFKESLAALAAKAKTNGG
jgi:methylthioribose-1-phosphate isomerase